MLWLCVAAYCHSSFADPDECHSALDFGRNALAATAQGDYQTSVHWAKKAIGCFHSPAFADGCYALASANIALRGHQEPASRGWLEKALEHSPRHAAAHSDLASILLSTGSPDLSLWHAQRAVLYSHKALPAAHYNAGVSHAALGEYRQAAWHLEETVRSAGTGKLRSMAPLAMHRLAEVAKEVGDYEGARRWYQNSLSMQPTGPLAIEALIGISKSLQREKRLTEARDVLLTSLRSGALPAKNAQVDEQLASVLYDAKDWKAACGVVLEAASYNGSHDGGYAAALCTKQHVAEQLLQTFNTSTSTIPGVQQVQRRHWRNLSTRAFHQEFALKRIPVVITGVFDGMLPTWDAEQIERVCGDRKATLKKRVVGAMEWANLREHNRSSIQDVFTHWRQDNGSDQLEGGMVFDWSIPKYCPKLAEEWVVPRYFAGDFLQRIPPSNVTSYRDVWPSLFVAPAGTRGGLHTDSFGSNFYQLAVAGRKRWVFFQEQDAALLGVNYLKQTYLVDAIEADLERFPLQQYASRFEAIIGPGDLIFVPAGAPHQVENLEPTIAISQNYVDASNFKFAVSELGIASRNPEGSADRTSALEILKYFQSPNFDTSTDWDMKELTFEKFKEQHRSYFYHN